MPSRVIYRNLPIHARLIDQGECKTLEHLCNALQPFYDDVARILKEQELFYTVEVTPDSFLDWLGQWVGLGPTADQYLGLGLNPDWPAEHKREVIRRAWNYWQIKGTKAGIREAYFLWLRWQADARRLQFFQPFGEAPTANPPGWWTYSTPFNSHHMKGWKEQRLLGSGDTPQTYSPQYPRLIQSDWLWEYGRPWSNLHLARDVAEPVQNTQSHLGPRNVWQHIEITTAEEWRQIFPNIHVLQNEVLDARARSVIFGWLNRKAFEPLPYTITDITQDGKTQEKVEYFHLFGFSYADLLPFAAKPASTKQIEVQTPYQFGYWPAFSYFDQLGAISPSELPDDQKPVSPRWWYAPFMDRFTNTMEEIEVPAVSCTPGVEAEVVVSTTTALVERRIFEESSLVLERIDAPQEEQPSPEAAERFAGIWQGYTYQTQLLGAARSSNPVIGADVAPLDVTGLTIDLTNFTPIDIPSVDPYPVSAMGRRLIFEQEQWYAAPTIPKDDDAGADEGEYSMLAPIRIATHFTPFARGYQWFLAGVDTKWTEEVTTRTTKKVRLCNVIKQWSDLTGELREFVIDLDSSGLTNFQRFPELAKLSAPQSWRLSLDTQEDLLLIEPTTFFWRSSSGGERSAVYSGLTPILQIEFLYEPGRYRQVKLIELLLGTQNVEAREFSPPIDIREGAFGFRFLIAVQYEQIFPLDVGGSSQAKANSVSLKATGDTTLNLLGPATSHLAGQGAALEFDSFIMSAAVAPSVSSGNSADLLIVGNAEMTADVANSDARGDQVNLMGTGDVELPLVAGVSTSTGNPVDLTPGVVALSVDGPAHSTQVGLTADLELSGSAFLSAALASSQSQGNSANLIASGQTSLAPTPGDSLMQAISNNLTGTGSVTFSSSANNSALTGNSVDLIVDDTAFLSGLNPGTSANAGISQNLEATGSIALSASAGDSAVIAVVANLTGSGSIPLSAIAATSSSQAIGSTLIASGNANLSTATAASSQSANSANLSGTGTAQLSPDSPLTTAEQANAANLSVVGNSFLDATAAESNLIAISADLSGSGPVSLTVTSPAASQMSALVADLNAAGSATLEASQPANSAGDVIPITLWKEVSEADMYITMSLTAIEPPSTAIETPSTAIETVSR